MWDIKDKFEIQKNQKNSFVYCFAGLWLKIGGKRFAKPHLNQWLATVACAYHPSDDRRPKIGGSQSKPPEPIARSHLQNNFTKRAGGVSQVV
jgi:hypothetical protein